MTVEAAIILLAALLVGGFSLFAVLFQRLETRIDRLDAKVDAIPGTLHAEFTAMRSEMAAQTSAIANVVTAARAMSG